MTAPITRPLAQAGLGFDFGPFAWTIVGVCALLLAATVVLAIMLNWRRK